MLPQWKKVLLTIVTPSTYPLISKQSGCDPPHCEHWPPLTTVQLEIQNTSWKVTPSKRMFF